jgi:hypothetical protein
MEKGATLRSCENVEPFTGIFDRDPRLSRIEALFSAFSSANLLYIPKNVRFLDGSAFVCNSIKSLLVDDENRGLCIIWDLLVDIQDLKRIG